MASPFSIFRKNQKLMMAVLCIGAMFIFVIGDAIDIGGGGRSSNDKDPVVATTKYFEVRETTLRRAVNDRRTVRQFLLGANFATARKALDVEVRQDIQAGLMRPMGDKEIAEEVDFRLMRVAGRIVQRVGNTVGSMHERDVMESLILAEQARQLGIQVSDQRVVDFINRITEFRLTPEELTTIYEQMRGDGESGPQLSRKQLYEAFRSEVLAIDMRRWFIHGPASASTPVDRWNYYLRKNCFAEAEVMAVSAKDVLGKIKDPSDAEVAALFEEHKYDIPIPGSPEPGFKIPQQAQFQYVTASEGAFFEPDKLTAEEVAEFYEKNKGRYDYKFENFEPRDPTRVTPDFDFAPDADATAPAATGPAATGSAATGPAGTAPAATGASPAPAVPAGTAPAATGTGATTSTGTATSKASPSPTAPKPTTSPTSSPSATAPKAEGSCEAPESNASGASADDCQPAAGDTTAKPTPSAAASPAAATTSSPTGSPSATKPAAALSPAAATSTTVPSTTAPSTTTATGTATPPAAVAASPSGTATPSSTASPMGTATPAESTAVKVPVAPPVLPSDDVLLPQDIKAGKTPLFDPLWKVERRVRAEIARDKATKKIDEVFKAIKEEMEIAALKRADASMDQLVFSAEQWQEIAKKHGLVGDTTPVTSQLEAALLSEQPGFFHATVKGTPMRVGIAAFEAAGTYTVTEASNTPDATDLSGEAAGTTVHYLYWKTKHVNDRVPELTEPEIRATVVNAWKMRQARDEIRKQAEELAAQARQSPNRSLAATFEGRDVRGTGPFTWFQDDLSGGFRQGEEPPELRLTDKVTGVEDPGPEFYRTAFSLRPDEVGTAMNNPQTVCYVIRLVRMGPSTLQLQPQFLIQNYQNYERWGRHDAQYETGPEVNEALIAAADLKWLREPHDIDR